MTDPICIKSGWIQVTVSPQKRFDNPRAFQEIIEPEELSSCLNSVRNIVEKIVEEQIGRSKLTALQDAKTRSIVNIYNSLVTKKAPDDKALLKGVLKTGIKKNMLQESRCSDGQI
jgi:hypothetical protein